jgi:hypothetical protein
LLTRVRPSGPQLGLNIGWLFGRSLNLGNNLRKGSPESWRPRAGSVE